jgi:hypothetical protein
MPRTKNKTQTKETVIALYCHYSGFSIVMLERITADDNYVAWQECEKRWSVAKVIKNIPSFEKIEKELLELKKANNYISKIQINKGFKYIEKIIDFRIKFTEVELDSKIENFGSFNADIFNLIALVNDRKIVFKKEYSDLVESIKFWNPANNSNELNALVLAIKSIPYYKINNMLYLDEFESVAEQRALKQQEQPV